MKLTSYQVWIRSLRHGAKGRGCISREAAYERLKTRTGEDYGYDIAKWREWGYLNPEETGMTRPSSDNSGTEA